MKITKFIKRKDRELYNRVDELNMLDSLNEKYEAQLDTHTERWSFFNTHAPFPIEYNEEEILDQVREPEIDLELERRVYNEV